MRRVHTHSDAERTVSLDRALVGPGFCARAPFSHIRSDRGRICSPYFLGGLARTPPPLPVKHQRAHLTLFIVILDAPRRVGRQGRQMPERKIFVAKIDLVCEFFFKLAQRTLRGSAMRSAIIEKLEYDHPPVCHFSGGSFYIPTSPHGYDADSQHRQNYKNSG